MISLVYAGMAMVIIGSVLIGLSIFLENKGSCDRVTSDHVGPGPDEKGSVVKGGGIIMLGPIPIVFGTDLSSVKQLVLLTLALMCAYLLLAFLLP